MVNRNRSRAGERVETTETLETAMKNGSEAFRTGFEKAVKGYDEFWGYGRETVEAYVKAANVAGKGVETLQNEPGQAHELAWSAVDLAKTASTSRI